MRKATLEDVEIYVQEMQKARTVLQEKMDADEACCFLA